MVSFSRALATGRGWGGHSGGQGPRHGHCASRGTMGFPLPPRQPICLSARRVSFPGLLALRLPLLPPGPRPLNREGTLFHTHTLMPRHTHTYTKNPNLTAHPTFQTQTDRFHPRHRGHELRSHTDVPTGSESQIHKHRTTGPEMPEQSCEPTRVAPRARTLCDDSP